MVIDCFDFAMCRLTLFHNFFYLFIFLFSLFSFSFITIAFCWHLPLNLQNVQVLAILYLYFVNIAYRKLYFTRKWCQRKSFFSCSMQIFEILILFPGHFSKRHQADQFTSFEKVFFFTMSQNVYFIHKCGWWDEKLITYLICSQNSQTSYLSMPTDFVQLLTWMDLSTTFFIKNIYYEELTQLPTIYIHRYIHSI